MIRHPPRSTLSPSTTLSRSAGARREPAEDVPPADDDRDLDAERRDVAHLGGHPREHLRIDPVALAAGERFPRQLQDDTRSEEHTSELQSRLHLVCRLLLEKKKKQNAKQHNLQPHITYKYQKPRSA